MLVKTESLVFTILLALIFVAILNVPLLVRNRIGFK